MAKTSKTGPKLHQKLLLIPSPELTGYRKSYLAGLLTALSMLQNTFPWHPCPSKYFFSKTACLPLPAQTRSFLKLYMNLFLDSVNHAAILFPTFLRLLCTLKFTTKSMISYQHSPRSFCSAHSTACTAIDSKVRTPRQQGPYSEFKFVDWYLEELKHRNIGIVLRLLAVSWR